jgi:hypothetical protein
LQHGRANDAYTQFHRICPLFSALERHSGGQPDTITDIANTDIGDD